jgi:NAD(P)H-hydrate repair Nnr-like enzyme with NAD(P)H-hydrate dehydratase domain
LFLGLVLSLDYSKSFRMSRFTLFTLTWKELFPIIRPVVPPLLTTDHKGSMGRIGVLGGSSDYTGAPFYAADAALKFGCDLSFVYCSKDASVPIKSYSPELMVTAFYDDTKMMSSDQKIIDEEVYTAFLHFLCVSYS